MRVLHSTFESLHVSEGGERIGWLSFLRTLVASNILWRDTMGFAYVMTEAQKHNLGMDDILCEELAWLAPFMFGKSAPPPDQLLGARLATSELPRAVAVALSLGLGETDWIFGTTTARGVSRMLVTKGFEDTFGFTGEKQMAAALGGPSRWKSGDGVIEMLLFPGSAEYESFACCYARAIADQTSHEEPGVATATLTATSDTTQSRELRVTCVYFGVGPCLNYHVTRLQPLEGSEVGESKAAADGPWEEVLELFPPPPLPQEAKEGAGA